MKRSRIIARDLTKTFRDDGRDLPGTRAEGLRQVADGDADAGHYLNLACAFLTKDMSTACLKGMGFSTASGTHTFIPRS